MRRAFFLSAIVLVGPGAGAQTPPKVVQPGAPGQPSVEAKGVRKAPTFTPADVKFMQGMIGHHQQALEMSDLVASRTTRDDLKLLAKKITVSQTDEIKMMQRWLEARKQEVP